MTEPHLLETHQLLVEGRQYVGVIAPEIPELRKRLEEIVGKQNTHFNAEERLLYCKTHKPAERSQLLDFAKKYETQGVKKAEGNYYGFLGWDWLDKLVRES